MIVVNEITGTAVLRIYRITKTDKRDDPAFVGSFKSHYELGQPPRRAETGWTIIYMGVSSYETKNRAVGTAEAFPVIGNYVAEVVLTAGNGFNYANTGPPGHLTVWGDPFKLAAAVADVVPVAG